MLSVKCMDAPLARLVCQLPIDHAKHLPITYGTRSKSIIGSPYVLNAVAPQTNTAGQSMWFAWQAKNALCFTLAIAVLHAAHRHLPRHLLYVQSRINGLKRWWMGLHSS